MSRICSFLYERFSSMGFECSLVRTDFLAIRWRKETDPSEFGCFVRVKGNLVIPMWTIESRHFLSKGFSPSSLAFILSNAHVDSMQTDIKVDMREGTVVISSCVRAPFLFGSLQSVYDQVHSTMLGIERKYEGILRGLELGKRSGKSTESVAEKANNTSTDKPQSVGSNSESQIEDEPGAAISDTQDGEANWVDCICGVRFSSKEPKCPACKEELIDAAGKNEDAAELVECLNCRARFSIEEPDCPCCCAPIPGSDDEGKRPTEEDTGKALAPNWLFKAMSYQRKGDYAKALSALDQAITLSPDYFAAWLTKARYFAKLGRKEEALDACNRATQIWPHHKEARTDKVLYLTKLGRIQEAFEALDIALELDQNYARAWYARGCLCAKAGRPEEALISLDQALEIDPKYALAMYGKNVVLAKLKRYPEAYAVIEAAMSITPADALQLHWASYCLAQLDRVEDALESINKAIEMDPENHRLWGAKGAYLKRLGRREEAESATERMKELQNIN